jgi:prophage maintenance system killer protein
MDFSYLKEHVFVLLEKSKMENQIEIYTTRDGKAQIDVAFEGETFWLSLNQISTLFERDKSVISRHLTNIFKKGELERDSVVAKNATTALDRKIYVVEYYNLDAILSVGYRVNSKRGTQFRQWATQRLKEYLTEGIALNEKRLNQKNKEIQVLHDGIRILSRAIAEKLHAYEGFDWLQQFNQGLQLLDDYDHEALDTFGNHIETTSYPSVDEYQELIKIMCSEFNSKIFGKVKDGGFDSAINQIKQGWGQVEFYPSIEEKAAMLLYLIVKNHAFVDGNKRIAAACFLLFLDKNNLLFDADKKPLISNDALTGLTLFVASSNPEEMVTVKKLVMSVLNRAK